MKALDVIIAPYSRDQEREADRFGLELMLRAGFDPQGAVRFQQRLQLLSDPSRLGILATHPQGEERVENMQRLIDDSARAVDSAGASESL